MSSKQHRIINCRKPGQNFWDGVLAVSINHQGCGIGRGLLQDAVRRTLLIADQAGIRALLAHPIDNEASRFYLRFGFVASPLREKQLLLLLKDARRLLL